MFIPLEPLPAWTNSRLLFHCYYTETLRDFEVIYIFLIVLLTVLLLRPRGRVTETGFLQLHTRPHDQVSYSLYFRSGACILTTMPCARWSYANVLKRVSMRSGDTLRVTRRAYKLGRSGTQKKYSRLQKHEDIDIVSFTIPFRYEYLNVYQVRVVHLFGDGGRDGTGGAR